MTEPLDQLLDRALADCARWHAGQRRRLTGAPYATHPVEVCKRLAEIGVDDRAVLAAAVLHDVVEDTPATLDDVRATYGDDVARWVGELTLAEGEDKAAYLAGFAEASAPALLVKLTDRYCNVLDWLTGGDRARATAYSAHAGALYDAVDARLDELRARFGETVVANARLWVAELRAIAAGDLPAPRGRAL